jgi:hypothetical protein
MPSSIRSTSRTILATLLAFSSGLLLAGAKMATPDDACSLLTKEDAAVALGEAVTGPKAKGPMADGTGATVSVCEYTGSGYNRIQLDLTRLPADAAPMYKAMCDQQDKTGLTGMGDVACWYNEKHAELHVIKGSAFLSIELQRSGDPTEPIKAVMKKALGRLK